ncbi:MAG TPA: ferritin-like domain-containing protein [Miltoncostaeaceae bacterium]|nr:ferritin-like domain-containing protein [Miltoncostaeaceae bacterium]
MTIDPTRAQFLSRGAKGGLALVAGGSVLGLAVGQAGAQTPSDVEIAKLAATAELLAIDFYTRALRSRKFAGDERRYLAEARANERAHYAALAKLLGPGAPKGVSFRYPRGAFGSRLAVARLGVALETAFVGAYLGAVTALSSNELKATAATIAANESQHLSVLSEIAKDDPVGPAFPKALTAAQATRAVTPFLAA